MGSDQYDPTFLSQKKMSAMRSRPETEKDDAVYYRQEVQIPESVTVQGCTPVPSAKTISTSVMAALMQNTHIDITAEGCFFQQSNAKSTFCTHFKGIAEEEEGGGTEIPGGLVSSHLRTRGEF